MVAVTSSVNGSLEIRTSFVFAHTRNLNSFMIGCRMQNYKSRKEQLMFSNDMQDMPDVHHACHNLGFTGIDYRSACSCGCETLLEEATMVVV